MTPESNYGSKKPSYLDSCENFSKQFSMVLKKGRRTGEKEYVMDQFDPSGANKNFA